MQDDLLVGTASVGETKAVARPSGTESSNPLPSSGESPANVTFGGGCPWGAKAEDCLPRAVAPGRAGLFSLIFVGRQSTHLELTT